MLTLFSTRRSKVDKGLSRIFKRRLTVALVAMLCVAAVVALPAFAYAANSPVDSTTVTNSTVKVVWDASALTGTLHKPVMTVSGKPAPAFVNGTNVYCTVSLPDGDAAVTASVLDGSGARQVAAPWSFTVSEAPKFQRTAGFYPGNNQQFSSAQTSAWFKATDNTGITVATATVNGTAATVTWDSANSRYNISGFSAGLPVNTIVATVQDAAGNSTSNTWTFSVPLVGVAGSCAGNACHAGDYQTGHDYASGGTASGHTVAGTGVTGAKTKFDGSQGVTLTWKATQSFTLTSTISASSTNGTAAVSAAPGTSFTAGQTGVVNSNWAFPTKSVFWPAVNDGVQNAPATAIKGLTKDSVITCEDCHTGLNASGPHGITTNFGLDSNYPGDYSLAELSKQVTSTFVAANTSSPGMTNGTASGIKVAPRGSAGTFLNTNQANMLDGTTGSNAVICAKCHRLETVVPAGTNQGQSGQIYPIVTGANTAHNSHHQDTAVGQCVSCHVAIPHGWKAPRLLVDVPKYEGTPWVSENAVEDMGTIAALNNHPLIGADGDLPYANNAGAKPANNLALSGTVLWDEGQCDACGDHYGNAYGTGTHQYTYSVPVRIDF